MKKSILSAVIFASVSASAFAADPIADTASWTGTVPEIVATNGVISINDLTANGLDAGELTFERDAAGTLALTAATSARFDVVDVATQLPVSHNITLTGVTATAGGVGMTAGSWEVSHNGTLMAANTPTADAALTADLTVDLTPAGLAELQPQENVEVSVVANISVAATI